MRCPDTGRRSRPTAGWCLRNVEPAFGMFWNIQKFRLAFWSARGDFGDFFEHNTTTNPQLFLLLMYYTYTILFGYKISIHLFASNSTTTIRTKQTLCLTT